MVNVVNNEIGVPALVIYDSKTVKKVVNEVNPCPFCGSISHIGVKKEYISRNFEHTLVKVFAYCEYCGATGRYQTVDDFGVSDEVSIRTGIKCWNHRERKKMKSQNFEKRLSPGDVIIAKGYELVINEILFQDFFIDSCDASRSYVDIEFTDEQGHYHHYKSNLDKGFWIYR